MSYAYYSVYPTVALQNKSHIVELSKLKLIYVCPSVYFLSVSVKF